MGKIVKVVSSIVGVIGASMLAALATKPDDAISNLSAWAARIHLDGFAAWLLGVPGSYYLVFLFGAAVFAAVIIIWLVTRGASGKLETRLEGDELRRLRAHGRAHEKYKKERSEVPKSSDDVEIGMSDTYKNNGIVYGNMGPTTNIYGRQKFQMTDAIMASVASQIGSPRTLGMRWIGSQQSFTDAERLARYLEQHGFVIVRNGGIGTMMPPLSKPIELRGNDLFVDSDK